MGWPKAPVIEVVVVVVVVGGALKIDT